MIRNYLKQENKFLLIPLVLACCYGFAYCTIFFISFKIPMFEHRYVLYLAPGIYIILASALANWAHCFKKKIIFIMFGICILGAQWSRYKKDYKMFWQFEYTDASSYVKSVLNKPAFIYIVETGAVSYKFIYAFDKERFQKYDALYCKLQ